MNLRPYIAKKLPLKIFKDCPDYLELLCKTHSALTCLDTSLSSSPYQTELLYILDTIEAYETLNSQKLAISYKEFWEFQSQPPQKSLQKKSLAEVQKMVKLLQSSRSMLRNTPINLDYILFLHSHLDVGVPSEIGHVRKRQNWIGPEGCPKKKAYFLPPSAREIPKLMQNLFVYARSKEIDPLLQVAISVAQLLVIHPFMDANGRVARILAADWIYKKGLTRSPCAYFSRYARENRTLYLLKLFEITGQNAWDKWIHFFLQGMLEQSLFAEKLMVSVHKIEQSMGKVLSSFPSEERQCLLKGLLQYPITNRMNLEKLTGLSSKKCQMMLIKMHKKKWICLRNDRSSDHTEIRFTLWLNQFLKLLKT